MWASTNLLAALTFLGAVHVRKEQRIQISMPERQPPTQNPLFWPLAVGALMLFFGIILLFVYLHYYH